MAKQRDQITMSPEEVDTFLHQQRSASVATLGPQGQVHLVGRCMPRYMCAFGITGWLDAVLACAKARGVSVAHGSCVHAGARSCRWDLRWEPSTVPRRRAVLEED